MLADNFIFVWRKLCVPNARNGSQSARTNSGSKLAGLKGRTASSGHGQVRNGNQNPERTEEKPLTLFGTMKNPDQNLPTILRTALLRGAKELFNSLHVKLHGKPVS